MMSLRRQLTRWLTGALAVLVGLTFVVIGIVVRNELVAAFDATVQARAAAIAALVEQKDGQLQTDFGEEFLRNFRSARPRNYFELWDAAGKRIARSPSLHDADLPRRESGARTGAKFWNIVLPNGRPGRAMSYSFVPQVDGEAGAGAKIGPVQLAVAVDQDDLEETLGGLLVAVAGAGVLLLAAVWFVVPWVLRQGLAPLEQLGEQMALIDADTLTAPLATAGLPSELRPIGDRLNDLLARLAASFERERRFSADLAHELRTPLAELRSMAECALKWPESRDATMDREVLAIATQMETLALRMLTLARGERGPLACELGSVEIAPLVAEAWRPFASRAEARGLRVSIVVAAATVRADAALLRSIAGNLFDNAVAYAPDGTEVSVTGELKADGYALRVANPAGDIAPGDVAKLFERFWRKEAARSGGGEHVGLGLSLAHTLAAAMGWRLAASLDARGWLVFLLETGGQ